MVSHSGSLQHGREGPQVDNKSSFTFTKNVGCSGSVLCVRIDFEEVPEISESIQQNDSPGPMESW